MQVVYLSDVSYLKKMLKITQEHAPTHFLAKMLVCVLRGDDGGAKDFIEEAEAQEVANSIPNAPSGLPIRLPSPPTFNPANVSQRAPVRTPVRPMRATGGRRLRPNRGTKKRKSGTKKRRTRRIK